MRTFLIGGGRDADGVVASHRPFVEAVTRRSDQPIVAFVLDEGSDTDIERWVTNLSLAGASSVRPIVVSADRRPCPADVAGAGGIYVAGGPTPGYLDALGGPSSGWLKAAGRAGLPYAGISAGAAVAARSALVGGWRAEVDGRVVTVCDEGAGEDLERVTVLAGLGLVPFVVDVHAGQWGTLARLLHALTVADARRGVAIDESTTLEVTQGSLRVHGLGVVYDVYRRSDAKFEVALRTANEQVGRCD